jgi:hypothetical protein
MTPRSLSLTCLALASLAVIGSVRAQSASISPFMPPAAVTTAAPTQGAPIEFRGYMESSEGMRFRVIDPSRKIGAWLKLNERDPVLDVVAKQFDGSPDSESLVVEYQGRTMKLVQRQGKVVSSGAAGANMPQPIIPQPPANVAPAVTQSVVVNPTPADEARRLDAVAQEVARRRALREQAAQGINQPAPQAVQPAAPPPQQPAQQQQRPAGGQRR